MNTSRRLQIARRSARLPSSSLSSAPRSIGVPNNRSPLTFYNFEPPSTAWPSFVPPVASSRSRRHDFFWHRIFKVGLASKSQRIDRYTFGVEYSPVPFSSEKCCSLSSRSNMHNLTTKQRAPCFQKRAGAETTLRTAWIKRPILDRFCLNNPPAGVGSKQFPEAAVVPGGWNRSPYIFLL